MTILLVNQPGEVKILILNTEIREGKNIRKLLNDEGLVCFETFHNIWKAKKMKCLFQTKVPPVVVYEAYEEEQEEEEQSLLTVDTRGTFIIIHFFIFG